MEKTDSFLPSSAFQESLKVEEAKPAPPAPPKVETTKVESKPVTIPTKIESPKVVP